MGSALSVNGKLQSIFKTYSTTQDRSEGYKPVEIGKPLIVRYLHFFLKHEADEKENELMISTFVKTGETKQAAAEAIHYFNPKAVFEDNELSIPAFGGELYGHPLIYYTKSYLGESIYLTTKIMELDKANDKVVKAIQTGIGTAASLPAFAEFLPYIAGATVGVSLFTKIIDFFDKDDAIIDGHHLDLMFDLNNVCLLQSGRFVCVPDLENEDLIHSNRFSLSSENKLIDNNTSDEYRESSYFVIQVDSKKNKKFEDFDYYLGAADLLRQTNRGGNPADIVNTVVEVLKSYNDIEAIKEIEDLSLDADDEETRKLIKAYHSSMSKEVRNLYYGKVRELTTRDL